MPMPLGWGTGGVQVTAAILGPDDVLKVIDQGSDDTTNAVSIRKFFARTAGVAVETRDISLAARILAAFPEHLTEAQRVPDALAELGAPHFLVLGTRLCPGQRLARRGQCLAGLSNLRARPRAKSDQTGRLNGMRLLVVEDNLINQQVAQELLSGEGATVQIAGNGQLGVAAVAQAHPPFDAVLMTW